MNLGIPGQHLAEASPQDYETASYGDLRIGDEVEAPPEWVPQAVSSKELMPKISGPFRAEGPQLNELIEAITRKPKSGSAIQPYLGSLKWK